jgi:hypothetical protein
MISFFKNFIQKPIRQESSLIGFFSNKDGLRFELKYEFVNSEKKNKDRNSFDRCGHDI